LFFNMPARRKFLRAESTEAAHVEHQLRLHALAAPQVRFRLRRDDREVFDLPPAATPLDRVRQLLGPELGRELIALPETLGNGVVVEGFVLPAKHARKGRRHQFVFLNGRPVEDAVISRALAEGFKGAVADGLHPAAWLWIDLEPTLVDVNVHPAKREVRFHRPLDVREVIFEAVTRGLRPPAPPPVAKPALAEAKHPAGSAAVGTQPPPVPAARALPEAFKTPQPALDDWKPAPAPETPEPEPVPPVRKGPDFRIIGMLKQRFVIMESDDGLVLFDPKAARERILYEQLLRHREQSRHAQPLLVPVLLEFDPRDCELLLREGQALAEAGIDLESFGGNTVQVRSLPDGFEVGDPRAFLGGVLDELLHDPASGARFAFERLARTLARRAALASEPRLAEARALLEELFQCELPYCAADGRPTLTEFGMRELERRFGISKP
jgi:DNA mismatch repair protein MutL